MNIQEAYQKLGLEDHIEYAAKQLKKEMHLQLAYMNLSSEKNERAYVWSWGKRQLGRTTYLAISAIVKAVNNNATTIFVEKNETTSLQEYLQEYMIRQIEGFVSQLNLKFEVKPWNDNEGQTLPTNAILTRMEAVREI